MQLLQKLYEQGFDLVLMGDRIGVKPADKLTPELIEQIRKHKPKLIKALRAYQQADQYSKTKYPPKPQHRCRACKSYDWWFSRYGVWTCRICHPPGPGAEVEPEVYQSIAKGQNVDSRGSEGQKMRWCTSYKPPRFVHVEVCSWHIQEADLACAECKHLTKAERETFMNSYLDGAINKLNSEGCRYYDTGDPQARRERIYKLEKRITEAFLIGDVKNFIEAVDSWQQCFRGATNV